MANPTPFTPPFDFSDFAESNPTTPLPGVQVDISLDQAAISINGTITALADVRRSDGALKNGIVTEESLATDVFDTLDAGVAAAAASAAAALVSESAAELAETNAEIAAASAAGAVVQTTANVALSQQAQSAAEMAKVSAQGAQSGAERARDDALDAQTAASASAAEAAAAEGFKDDAEAAAASVLGMQTDLENALDAIAGLNYTLDWGDITEPAGVTHDYGDIV